MATERFFLNPAAWTDLGPTPCFLQLELVYPVRFVLDTAPPADLAAPAHVLTGAGEASWCDVGMADRRVYARAVINSAVVVVSR